VHTTFEVWDTLLHIALVQIDRPDMETRKAKAIQVIDRLGGPDRFLFVGDSFCKLATFAERVP
jgi:hypothetical protein